VKRLLTLITSLTALPLLTLAALALAGVSVVRHPEPLPIALATALLLSLPVLGFSAVVPNRRAGLLMGANLWPVLLLMGLPLYFPGERQDAIEMGMGLLVGPLGTDLSAEQRRAVAETIDELLVEPSARPPSPRAEPLVEAPPPPSLLDEDADQVALPYEGRGHSLLIPVELEGPNGRIIETDMLFDTGATYTTLDRRTLRELGLGVPDDAPQITFHTANGEATSSLVVLDRIWLGGFEVAGATVAVCDQCTSSGAHAGLLGLNVSSRFLITLDTARREVILEPRAQVKDQLDLRPWLDLSGRGATWPDGRTEVTVTATNMADRPVERARVEVRCAGERFELTMGPFAARETLEAQASIPPPTDCDPFTIELATGAW
jgi:predicted aspartyl protease